MSRVHEREMFAVATAQWAHVIYWSQLFRKYQVQLEHNKMADISGIDAKILDELTAIKYQFLRVRQFILTAVLALYYRGSNFKFTIVRACKLMIPTTPNTCASQVNQSLGMLVAEVRDGVSVAEKH